MRYQTSRLSVELMILCCMVLFGSGGCSSTARINFANSVGMEMIYLSAQEIWVSKYETRQRDYEAVMGSNPSHFRGPDKPVDSVSWEDAMEFCRRLTEREAAAGRLPADYVYTLPTFREWAAALGDALRFREDRAVNMWRKAEFGGAPQGPEDVGTGETNRHGICDMAGNVSERSRDMDGPYWVRDSAEPPSPYTYGYHWARLAGLHHADAYYRSTADNAADRAAGIGFRCVLVSRIAACYLAEPPADWNNTSSTTPPIDRNVPSGYGLYADYRLVRPVLLHDRIRGKFSFALWPPDDEQGHYFPTPLTLAAFQADPKAFWPPFTGIVPAGTRVRYVGTRPAPERPAELEAYGVIMAGPLCGHRVGLRQLSHLRGDRFEPDSRYLVTFLSADASTRPD